MTAQLLSETRTAGVLPPPSQPPSAFPVSASAGKRQEEPPAKSSGAEPHLLFIGASGKFLQELEGKCSLHEQYTVSAALSVRDGIWQATEERHNLILVDADASDIDAFTVCRLMRRSGVKAPIVLLLRCADDAAVILTLESGGNDCIAKSADKGVLLARLRAHMRQYEQSEDAELVVGPYLFRPAAKLLVVRSSHRRIRLTKTECEILRLLYQSRPRQVTRKFLLDEVWGYAPNVDTHTVESHVYRMRQKIEDDPTNPTLLLTERAGYRLA